MIAARSLTMHVAILAIAAILALRTYTADEDAAREKHTEVELWGGSPSKIQRVRFEHEQGTMTLEPRKDSEGVYYVGTVVKTKAEPAKNPHDPHGAAQSQSSEPPAPEGEAGKPEKTTAHFVTVGEGEDLFEKLAPLNVLRVLGKIDEARSAEFGFDETEGTLYVKIGGNEHSLVFGGSTPGGTDRYVRDPSTGEAYVISGSIMRDMMNADQRLVQRDLHEWDNNEAKRIKVSRGDVTRELVRSDEKSDFWARPDSPQEKDETASNWMSKVERLRVTSYEGEKLAPPPKPEDLVVKIEYFDDRDRKLGHLELVRRAGDGQRPEYVARTEHTRWWATVLGSTGEQIDQDVSSVLNP